MKSAKFFLKRIPVNVVHSLHVDSTPRIRLCGWLE
jgi:hypothetical protein